MPRSRVPSAEEHEAFVLGEWSGAVGRGDTFDLVLAFDSFNMLHTEDLRRLAKALRGCVKPQSCIVMQWANMPDAAYLETCRSGSPEPTLREAFSTLMRGAVDRASDHGDTLPDHHEMFARLALSQFRASDRRLLLRPVIDFLTNSIVALDPKAESLALKMQKTYALCNTTLFFHSHLQEGVGLKQLDVQRVNRNKTIGGRLSSVLGSSCFGRMRQTQRRRCDLVADSCPTTPPTPARRRVFAFPQRSLGICDFLRRSRPRTSAEAARVEPRRQSITANVKTEELGCLAVRIRPGS